MKLKKNLNVSGGEASKEVESIMRTNGIYRDEVDFDTKIGLNQESGASIGSASITDNSKRYRDIKEINNENIEDTTKISIRRGSILI